MGKPELGTPTLRQSLKTMALYHWLCRLEDCALTHNIQQYLENLGYEIDPSATSRRQLYATERLRTGVSAKALVTILISQVDTSNHEYQVEVRSSEPMVRADIRCRQRADELRALIPPLP